ncbi:MAG TPA: hypothetical protein VFD48_07010, partial [Pyrinomonadaceae bacterium]|nr:hypothetical protein [Pyrinomonadaceae bacterium]
KQAADTSGILDPEFFKQYEHGRTVLVTESSNQNVEVKMIPAQFCSHCETVTLFPETCFKKWGGGIGLPSH